MLCAAIAGAAGLVASASSTLAANYTWDGGASSNAWKDGNNWNPDTANGPATGSDLFFNAANNGYASLNNNITTSGYAVKSFTFQSGAPSYTITGNAITLNGTITNSANANQTIALDMLVGSSRSVLGTAGSSVELSGNISGAGGFTAGTAGTVILSGNSSNTGDTSAGPQAGVTVEFRGSNSSSGNTVAAYGTLALNSTSNGGLASGVLNMTGSVGTGVNYRLVAYNADRSLTNAIRIGTSAGNEIGGSYSITFTNNDLRPNAANSSTTLGNYISGAGKKLTLNDINIGHSSSTAAYSLTLRGTGTTVVNGTIANGNSYANSMITGKVGVGTNNEPTTVVFMSTNTYTGTTTVANGTLLVNGANTGTGAVTVNATGKLGGTGSIAGAVSLVDGARLAPGASIQSLATGALTLAGGSNLDYELDSAALPGVGADLAVVSGNLALTSGMVKLNLSDLSAGTFGNGLAYTVVNYTGSLTGTGLFSVDNGVTGLADGDTFVFGGNTWTIDYDATSGGMNFTGDQLAGKFVNISTVPEPTSAAGLLVAGSLLALRRKNRRPVAREA